MDNADFMLELKNYPETRKYAIVSHDEIKKEDHYKWLREHIDEFRVCSKYDGTRVAVVRVNKEYELSIWVDRKFWEFGVATYLLSRHDLEGALWAKIVNGNVASFRAFVKAGWKPVEYKDNYYILRK